MSSKNKKRERDNVEATKAEMNREGNPYAEEVSTLVSKVTPAVWNNFFDDSLSNEVRQENWDVIEQESAKLVERYAWAIPDDRSIRILQHFSPLIEIGGGKGYWAKLLRDKGVDIITFDKYLSKNSWSEVRKGGPEVLRTDSAGKRAKKSKQSERDYSIAGRNLFLCYPDEQESIAVDCLEHYDGEYIIHVGEMIWTGTLSGAPVAPFGRTSSADFQVSLAEKFHCILQAQLSLRYPICNDCISVWKRTKFIPGKDLGATVDNDTPAFENSKKKNAKETPKENKASDGAVSFISAEDLKLLREAALDVQYSEEKDNLWASIPDEERMPIDRVAPCLKHLL